MRAMMVALLLTGCGGYVEAFDDAGTPVEDAATPADAGNCWFVPPGDPHPQCGHESCCTPADAGGFDCCTR